MSRLANFTRSLAQISLVAVLSVAVITGLFVAWWVGVFTLLAYSLYIGVRRIMGPKRRASAGGGVIEGEYRVVDEPMKENSSRLHDPARTVN